MALLPDFELRNGAIFRCMSHSLGIAQNPIIATIKYFDSKVYFYCVPSKTHTE